MIHDRSLFSLTLTVKVFDPFNTVGKPRGDHRSAAFE